jgi:pyruvate/2-oxoglutarate dehydrogenase complex dihydrolipoamide acyltransferase (E2) component
VRQPTLLAPALAAALLTACASTGGGGQSTDSPATPSPSRAAPTSPTTASDPAEVEGSPSTRPLLPADLREQPAVEAALADAARRQRVSEGDIALASWSPVTWDDGSIGCPRPGKAYTQSTVDGWLLLLRVEMTLLAYHAGPDGEFHFCAEPDGGFIVRES